MLGLQLGQLLLELLRRRLRLPVTVSEAREMAFFGKKKIVVTCGGSSESPESKTMTTDLGCDFDCAPADEALMIYLDFHKPLKTHKSGFQWLTAMTGSLGNLSQFSTDGPRMGRNVSASPIRHIRFQFCFCLSVRTSAHVGP